ncbi:hypothetical protein BCR34DRAFT_63074 [Clohesyomyces aquaticus]|uniref:C2H2-type domain-containing protein n=1 Tax=Clohesyomyces aquaticus TaxID=1231657 RepID=A0A1Y1Z148_9PLEO|nr:hypothetical protein BCR34DRAFT_63074 [Clohesyomyces aquaticus]
MDGYPDSWQYNDIPQIQLAEDSVLNLWSNWSNEYIGHIGQFEHHDSKTIRVFGEEITLDGLASQGFSTMPMHRWLHGQDRSPVAPGLLHAKLNSGHSSQTQHWRQYEQWPPCDVVEHPREWSPVQTTSSETTQTTQNDNPHIMRRVSYGSPIEQTHLRLPYPSQEQLGGGAHDHRPLVTDASISLRDLEYEHMDVEATVEDHEHTDVKPELDYEQEPAPAPTYTKMEGDGESYHSCHDSGLGHSVRDAESVQPAQSDEEASDSDYKPAKRRRSSQSSNGSGRQPHKRNSHKRKRSITSPASTSHKVQKRPRGSNASLLSATNDAQNPSSQRPFPCPLAIYGCQSNFVSKNEWKRHVSTQHIKLGFWRCDLCSTSVDSHDPSTVYHNDFNRKDLFTQHLRRMHAAPSHQTTSARNQKEYPVTEDNLVEHQQRCFKTLRSAPPLSSCLFCEDRVFQGPGGWDERMEHVGRHLEKDRKAGGAPIDISDWKEDTILRQWFLEEGLIAPDHNGVLKLGDGKPKRNLARNSEEDSDVDE